MEFIKQIFNTEDNNDLYNLVDVYNKKKYQALKYFDFLTKTSVDEVCHLAEMPIYPSPLIVDVDIKVKGKKIKNLYDEEMIREIILSYTTILDEQLQNKPEDYKIFFLQKDPRICGEYIKHGFHLHFINVSLGKDDLKRVHTLAREICENDDLLDDISTKPWLLYGCSKSPEDSPYLITKAYIVGEDAEITVVDDYESILVGEKYMKITIDRENVKSLMRAIMSIRSMKNLSMQSCHKLKPYINHNVSENTSDNSSDDSSENTQYIPKEKTQHIDIDTEKIGEIVLCLNEKRADNYDDWMKVAMILTSVAKRRNEDAQILLKGHFHLFSKKSSKYNDAECENKWNNLMKSSAEGLGLGTLIYMAKEDGNFSDIREVICNFTIDRIPVDDYDIAKMIKTSITDMYATHKDYGCYILESTIWKEVAGWECVFKKHVTNWSEYYIRNLKKKISERESDLNDELENLKALEEDRENVKEDIFEVKEKMIKEVEFPRKSLVKLEKKVKNYSSLNNIVKSLFDLYFDSKVETLFEQKENLISFKNCVFDIENWKILPPNPDHFFRVRIEHDLEEWSDAPEENKEFVLDFWEKIFPNEQLREYVVKNMARFITGQNTFKQFQFWTGTGNNGKSVCISLMEYIFGRMSMKVPKTVVTGSVHKQGGACPELFRLKDARIAVIDEVTNNDFLDPGQIKGLTGNDKLYGRDLYQRSKDIKEIIPMFFPVLITNETPIIKRPDDATWGRIRLIRFESKFKSNPEEYLNTHPEEDSSKIFKSDPRIYDKLKKNAKYFLSYFMHILFQSKSFEDFNDEEILPDMVIEGLKTFKEGQNIMLQYMDEHYSVDESSSFTISLAKLTREYNATRPKITLNIHEVAAAIEMYCNSHPGTSLINGKIKGLQNVE